LTHRKEIFTKKESFYFLESEILNGLSGKLKSESKPEEYLSKPTVLIVNLTLKSRKMENHLHMQYCSKVQTQ
jgi:hypothetical protein